MTKLEELKAALASAEDAADAARARAAAYEAELKKQGEKQNDLALSTNEAHRT